MLLPLLLLACFGGPDESAGPSESCPDPQAASWPGPNLLGGWTSSYGQNFSDGICNVEGFSEVDQPWISAFTVDGSVPSNFYLYFDLEQTGDTELFTGAGDRNGGVSFSGQHVVSAGTVYAQFGGFAYHDPLRDRDTIVGAAYLGLDQDGDAAIDCYVRGSWTAFKSGN